MVTSPKWARIKDMLVAIGTCLLYAYTTIVFSSLQLVSAINVLNIPIIYVVCTPIARLIAVWLLEVTPEDITSGPPLPHKQIGYSPIGSNSTAG